MTATRDEIAAMFARREEAFEEMAGAHRASGCAVLVCRSSFILVM